MTVITNNLLKGLFVLCVTSSLLGNAQVKKESRPNIIVFLVDDMGWQDTSVPFWSKKTPLNKRYSTPSMERLAAEGVKFTNAYSTPICTPTRVSLFTGTNAARHRVTNWTSPNPDSNTDYPDSLVNSVDWNINGLSPLPGISRTFYATPLPILLKANGYYTVLSGKAHFGSAGKPGADPLKLGFDVNIAGSEIGHPASYLGVDNFDSRKDGVPNRNAVPGLEAYYGKNVFLTDVLVAEAFKAIESPIKNRKPFFLYLTHYAVHTPIQADERFAGKYRKAGLDSKEAAYASLIEGMDKSLGDVLAFLDKKGISDNTVIIFTSDNGGLSLVPPRGGTTRDVHNLPLRAGKGSVYEGGIRVPLLVKWPGQFRKGAVSDQYVIVEDLFPTILDIARVGQIDVNQVVDGRSFLPDLKDPTRYDSSRVLIWHHPNRWIPSEGPLTSWAGALRKGDWKLLYDYRLGSVELYNLKKDIGERHDLARENPETVRRLAKLLTKELKEKDAQMPTFKDGTLVPWPDEVINTK